MHGDQATLQAYVQMYVLIGEPPRQEVTASGTYADTLSKVDGNLALRPPHFTVDA